MPRIGTTLPLAILIVGILGMGSATVTSVEAVISERHSVGIELIILVRKTLCSGLISEEISQLFSQGWNFL